MEQQICRLYDRPKPKRLCQNFEYVTQLPQNYAWLVISILTIATCSLANSEGMYTYPSIYNCLISSLLIQICTLMSFKMSNIHFHLNSSNCIEVKTFFLTWFLNGWLWLKLFLDSFNISGLLLFEKITLTTHKFISHARGRFSQALYFFSYLNLLEPSFIKWNPI